MKKIDHLPTADATRFVYQANRAIDAVVGLALVIALALSASALSPFFSDGVSQSARSTHKARIVMAPPHAGETPGVESAARHSALPYVDMFPTRTGNPLRARSDAFINLFGDGDLSKSWSYSQFRGSNHYWVDFVKDNVLAGVRGLEIFIREKRAPKDRFRWTAGEISTRKRHGYGRYEAIMKPAYGSGLVTSFFTYTGPYFKKPHDEIDFEFVGRNPRQVELNSWRNGRSHGYKRVNLWFDATADYHLYAFEWRPDSIKWFVDGQLVGEVVGDDRVIPQTPGAIYLNLWSGRPTEWHGRPTFGRQAVASYACVSYRPLYEKSRSCADVYDFPEASEALR